MNEYERLKLYEKRLDDNHIPKRSNSDICDMYIKVKDRLWLEKKN